MPRSWAAAQREVSWVLVAYARAFESEIIGHVGVKPFGTGIAVALHGRELHRPEAGLRDVVELSFNPSTCPVKAVKSVSVLDIGGETVIGRHRSNRD